MDDRQTPSHPAPGSSHLGTQQSNPPSSTFQVRRLATPVPPPFPSLSASGFRDEQQQIPLPGLRPSSAVAVASVGSASPVLHDSRDVHRCFSGQPNTAGVPYVVDGRQERSQREFATRSSTRLEEVPTTSCPPRVDPHTVHALHTYGHKPVLASSRTTQNTYSSQGRGAGDWLAKARPISPRIPSLPSSLPQPSNHHVGPNYSGEVTASSTGALSVRNTSSSMRDMTHSRPIPVTENPHQPIMNLPSHASTGRPQNFGQSSTDNISGYLKPSLRGTSRQYHSYNSADYENDANRLPHPSHVETAEGANARSMAATYKQTPHSHQDSSVRPMHLNSGISIPVASSGLIRDGNATNLASVHSESSTVPLADAPYSSRNAGGREAARPYATQVHSSTFSPVERSRSVHTDRPPHDRELHSSSHFSNERVPYDQAENPAAEPLSSRYGRIHEEAHGNLPPAVRGHRLPWLSPSLQSEPIRTGQELDMQSRIQTTADTSSEQHLGPALPQTSNSNSRSPSPSPPQYTATGSSHRVASKKNDLVNASDHTSTDFVQDTDARPPRARSSIASSEPSSGSKALELSSASVRMSLHEDLPRRTAPLGHSQPRKTSRKQIEKYSSLHNHLQPRQLEGETPQSARGSYGVNISEGLSSSANHGEPDHKRSSALQGSEANSFSAHMRSVSAASAVPLTRPFYGNPSSEAPTPMESSMFGANQQAPQTVHSIVAPSRSPYMGDASARSGETVRGDAYNAYGTYAAADAASQVRAFHCPVRNDTQRPLLSPQGGISYQQNGSRIDSRSHITSLPNRQLETKQASDFTEQMRSYQDRYPYQMETQLEQRHSSSRGASPVRSARTTETSAPIRVSSSRGSFHVSSVAESGLESAIEGQKSVHLGRSKDGRSQRTPMQTPDSFHGVSQVDDQSNVLPHLSSSAHQEEGIAQARVGAVSNDMAAFDEVEVRPPMLQKSQFQSSDSRNSDRRVHLVPDIQARSEDLQAVTDFQRRAAPNGTNPPVARPTSPLKGDELSTTNYRETTAPAMDRLSEEAFLNKKGLNTDAKQKRSDSRSKQHSRQSRQHASSVIDSGNLPPVSQTSLELREVERSRNVLEAVNACQHMKAGVADGENIRNDNLSAQLDAQDGQARNVGRTENVIAMADDEALASQGQPRRQLKVEDALAYLEQVKSQFEDQPTVYNHFLDIMKEFKSQTIDTAVVIKRVSQLFRGHKDLILGFNTFLPPGFIIEGREDEETGLFSAGFSGPKGFNELPQQQTQQPLMAEPMTANPKPPTVSAAPEPSQPSTEDQIETVHNAVPDCSRDHDDSPRKKKSSPIPKRKESKGKGPLVVEPAGAVRALEDASLAASLKEQVSNETSEVPVASSERNARNVSAEPALGMSPRHSKELVSQDQSDFEQALDFMHCLKQRLSPQRFEDILEALDGYLVNPVAYTVIVTTLSDLVGPENKDLVLRFTHVLPAWMQYRGSNECETNRVQSRRIASRRSLPDQISSDTRRNLASQNGVALGSSYSRLTTSTDLLQFFEDMKLELGESSPRLYTDFIKCLSLFSHAIISREELVLMVAELFHDFPAVHSMFLHYLDAITFGTEDESISHASSGSTASPNIPMFSESRLDENQRSAIYRSKPISEIAADSDVGCTASYRRLPSDYPSLTCSGRSVMEKRTINDIWVSVTSGSEDYSFKFMRKNQYEDSLFRCEDDRYELDLVIEANAATILKLEPIATTIAKLPNSEKRRHFLADGALSPVHFNAIQRIYGDSGPDVVQQVKLNPAVAVPIVLERLRDKDDQWRRARLEMNSIWREVGEKNYHRSLDHRSAYFKQVDKKELSSKSLLADIFDPVASHAARQAEMTRARGYTIPSGGGKPNDRSPAADAVALLAAVGPTDTVPSLELNYAEFKVHQVIFALVKRAVLNSAHNRDDEHDLCIAVCNKYKMFVKEFFHVDLEKGHASAMSHLEQVARVVMYGDESVYLFFRLHHLLFERLTAAVHMSREAAEDQKFRNECNEKGFQRIHGHRHMPNFDTKPSDLTKMLAVNNPNIAVFQVCSGITEEEVIFQEFLDVLFAFLDGNIDPAKYEDRCRVLLGVDAYCLSTVEKTLSKLVKQVLLIFSEDSATSDFLSLFHASRVAIKTAKTWESVLGVEDMYSIAASSALRRRRGAGANLFRLQNIRRPVSSDLLVIHVIGITCSDDEETRRFEDSNAIDLFLGFCGLGSAQHVSDSSTMFGEMSKDPAEHYHSCREILSEQSLDSQREIKNGRATAIAISRKRNSSSISQHAADREVPGLLCEVGDGQLDSCDDKSRDELLKDCEQFPSRRRAKEFVTNCFGRKCDPDFLRFAGSQYRLGGPMIMRNEIEYRVGLNSRLYFVDGKSDVLVNLGRKRKWQSAHLPQPDVLQAKRVKVSESTRCGRRFRQFLSKQLAGTPSSSTLDPIFASKESAVMNAKFDEPVIVGRGQCNTQRSDVGFVGDPECGGSSPKDVASCGGSESMDNEVRSVSIDDERELRVVRSDVD